jgi:hypothetical protein
VRLYLNTFRGEPAISVFDWHFTRPSPIHPKPFQRLPVRASTACYRGFTLTRDRSHSFGSTLRDSIALLRLAFATAPCLKHLTKPHKVTRWLILQKARRQASRLPGIALRLFVSARFQVLFHSPSGVLFTFPSRYWLHYRWQRVFSLTRWYGQIHAGYYVSRVTWVSNRRSVLFAYEALTLYGVPFQATFAKNRLGNSLKVCRAFH